MIWTCGKWQAAWHFDNIFEIEKKKVKQLLMKLFPWEVTWRSLRITHADNIRALCKTKKKTSNFSLERIRIDAKEKNYHLPLIRNQRRFSFRIFRFACHKYGCFYFYFPLISFINIQVIITYIKSKTLYLKHYTFIYFFSSFIWHEYFECVGEIRML